MMPKKPASLTSYVVTVSGFVERVEDETIILREPSKGVLGVTYDKILPIRSGDLINAFVLSGELLSPEPRQNPPLMGDSLTPDMFFTPREIRKKEKAYMIERISPDNHTVRLASYGQIPGEAIILQDNL